MKQLHSTFYFIIALWGLQGLLMVFDEFKFHHARGLSLWERIGHPIDTFFFLMPFLYTQFYSNTYVFIGLCLFSSLTISKDEFVHSQVCSGKEMWLHAVLFVIHPVALYGLWQAWLSGFEILIQVQSLIIFLFMCYQVFYWNFKTRTENEATS